MGRADQQHQELVGLIPTTPGTRVVEIGFGPGQILASLRAKEPTVSLAGVDPSELMVAAALRRNPGADLRVGAAAAMPFEDATADIVVSVNNMPMWPDVDAALVEIRRVIRPGGLLLIAWHGGTDPRGHQRQLTFPPERLTALDATIRRHFSGVQRRPLRHSELWEAHQPGSAGIEQQ